MKIFYAVGFGIAIIILKLLLARPFAAFEDTAVVFFGVIKNLLEHLQTFQQGNNPPSILPY